jgi:hypothetical protein
MLKSEEQKPQKFKKNAEPNLIRPMKKHIPNQI